MALDAQLLQQVLTMPESRDVTASPLVTAVILTDPANAAALVPALAETESLASRNARRILCLFDAEAVPFLLGTVAGGSATLCKDAVEIMWAMFIGEERPIVRETLARVAAPLGVLMNDKRPLPDDMPAFIERDFHGRICDLTYGVLRILDDPEYDRSAFSALDDDARDQEIARFKNRALDLS